VTNPPAIRLATLACSPGACRYDSASVPAFAAGAGEGGPGGDRRRPPLRVRTADDPWRPDHTEEEKDKQSGLVDPAFAQGYRTAYATIYDRKRICRRHRPAKGAGPRRSSERGNLIGYSYRKLGDYKLAQAWYERALKADPNHVLTCSITACGRSSRANRDQAQ